MAHFRVYWKFPKCAAKTQDYEMADLATVLRILLRSHNVCPTTVQELVIHEIKPDGKVHELVAYGSAPPWTAEKEKERSPNEGVNSNDAFIEFCRNREAICDRDVPVIANIKTIIENKRKMKGKKPHLRLVAKGEPVPIVLGGFGLFRSTATAR